MTKRSQDPRSPFLWKQQERATDIGAPRPGNRSGPARSAAEARRKVMANRWGNAYSKPGRVD